jgi:cell wall-associated NlpC family hydrolase
MNLHLRRLGATALTTVLAVVTVTALAGPVAAAPQPRVDRIARAMSTVMAQQGDPYIYGAEGPNAFDCSGLVQYSYGRAGLTMPRSADEQYRHVRHIRKVNLQRGDFLYWHSGGHVFHTAVFAGRHGGTGWVWEAAHTGTNVGLHRVWDAPRWAGTLRIKH